MPRFTTISAARSTLALKQRLKKIPSLLGVCGHPENMHPMKYAALGSYCVPQGPPRKCRSAGFSVPAGPRSKRFRARSVRVGAVNNGPRRHHAFCRDAVTSKTSRDWLRASVNARVPTPFFRAFRIAPKSTGRASHFRGVDAPGLVRQPSKDAPYSG
jgi:hypothetical protein